MENRLARLKELIEAHPDDAFLNYAIGLEYWGDGDHHSALQYLEKLKNTQPEYLATYYQLGKLLEELNREQEALAVFEAGIEVAKNQNNQKTLEELQEAYEQMVDEDWD